eukprot:455515_1
MKANSQSNNELCDKNIFVTEEICNNSNYSRNKQTDINEYIIQNAIVSTEKLMQLAIQIKRNNVFYNVSTHAANLIVEYGNGSGESDSSSNLSSGSGESKQSDDQNGNNSNNNSNHNNSNDNNHDCNDRNGDNNDKKECHVHKYNCNVPEHAFRLKQLEEENKQLKLLLQKQEDTDEKQSTEKFVFVSKAKKRNKNGTNTQHTKQEENKNDADHNVKENQISKDVILSRKLRNQEIPRYETFCNVLVYLKQYLCIHKHDAVKKYKYKQNIIKVIDYNIHCTETQESLYVICDKEYDSNNKEYIWKTRDHLYTKSELEKLYNTCNNIPPAALSLNETKMSQINQSKQQIMHMLQNTKQRNCVIGNKHTPWNREDKIPIFNKSSKNSGLCLILSKEEFVNR